MAAAPTVIGKRCSIAFTATVIVIGLSALGVVRGDKLGGVVAGSDAIATAREALLRDGWTVLRDAIPVPAVERLRSVAIDASERLAGSAHWSTGNPFDPQLEATQIPDAHASFLTDFHVLQTAAAVLVGGCTCRRDGVPCLTPLVCQDWTSPQYTGGGVHWDVPHTQWHKDLGILANPNSVWEAIGASGWHDQPQLCHLTVSASSGDDSFATCKLVLYLQPHNAETGFDGLRVVNGSHLVPGTNVVAESQREAVFLASTHVTTRPGDVVLFDVRLTHMGGVEETSVETLRVDSEGAASAKAPTRGYWMATIQDADNEHSHARTRIDFATLAVKARLQRQDVVTALEEHVPPPHVARRLAELGWGTITDVPSARELARAEAAVKRVLGVLQKGGSLPAGRKKRRRRRSRG